MSGTYGSPVNWSLSRDFKALQYDTGLDIHKLEYIASSAKYVKKRHLEGHYVVQTVS